MTSRAGTSSKRSSASELRDLARRKSSPWPVASAPPPIVVSSSSGMSAAAVAAATAREKSAALAAVAAAEITPGQSRARMKQAANPAPVPNP